MKKCIILFIVALSIYCGCANKSRNNSSVFDEYYCFYTFDKDSVKNGEYTCFYSSGEVYQTGVIEKDTLNVNEEITYYTGGNMKTYAFYNPVGEQRFLRVYNEQGVLQEEYGDFYSHVNIHKSVVNLRDSIILDFHIASPPDTYYRIFWIDQNGRHEIDNMDTVFPYLRRLTIVPKRAASYILPHEVEFYDTIKGTKEIRKYDISFDVINK